MEAKNWLIDCVKDMGCDPAAAKQLVSYAKRREWEYALCVAKQQKKRLLEELHLVERQIDCLDDLIYRMNQMNGGKSNDDKKVG